MQVKTPVPDSPDHPLEAGDVDGGLPADATALKSMQQRLVTGGSIELTSGLDSVDAAEGRLPTGTPVFVPSLPKRPLKENLATLKALKQRGFEPVPHLAARRLRSAAELQQFLGTAVREAAVNQVLLIGGDVEIHDGPFASAEDVLRSGLLQEAGINAVGVAAYPETHPRIDEAELDRSLAVKVDLMRQTGLSPFVVTQFSLDPKKPIELCGHLARKFPDLPLFVGVPGPTSVTKLIKYARFCGVGASVRALKTMGLKAARLGDRAASDEQLRTLAEYCLGHGKATVRGVHLFSFGGFPESVEWMSEKAPIDRSGVQQAALAGDSDGEEQKYSTGQLPGTFGR